MALCCFSRVRERGGDVGGRMIWEQRKRGHAPPSRGIRHCSLVREGGGDRRGREIWKRERERCAGAGRDGRGREIWEKERDGEGEVIRLKK
jgi:hypothetical protein